MIHEILNNHDNNLKNHISPYFKFFNVCMTILLILMGKDPDVNPLMPGGNEKVTHT